ncbi:putative reverse transcriptase domain-containing protein [Tanacetum coccineum]|uniref:Reverse transcriptase domain-containing protein n=1 Tax=Tanacetum coccineum TaxID=301880 RepID=A0ABQ5FKS9_9ASTR
MVAFDLLRDALSAIFGLSELKEIIIMEYLVKISKKARILELKRRHFEYYCFDIQYAYPLRKIRRICACTSLKTTKEQDPIRRIQRRPIRRIQFILVYVLLYATCHSTGSSDTDQIGKDLVSGLLVYELPLSSLRKKYRLSLKNDMPPQDKKLLKTLSLDESRSSEFNLFSDLEEYFEEEVAETMEETMEQYMSKTRADYGSGIARPKIDDKDSFELKGQFLKELRDNTFSGSDHEDANEHIEKVLEIVDLFHIPNITQDQVMLRAFPMSLTRATSCWLRNKPSGSITTWEDLKTKFRRKYCPPARTAKKMEEINNF